MGHLKAWWNSGSETQRREHFVRIIVLDNITNCLDGSHILIWPPIWVSVMEGVCVGRVSVGAGEVDGNGEVDLEPSVQVVQEGRVALHPDRLENQRSGIFVLGTLLLSLLLIDQVICIV